LQISNTTPQPIQYNTQLNSNQPNKNEATTTPKYTFSQSDKELVNYFELSEDISDYQVSDSKKKQIKQTGTDVLETMINLANKREFKREAPPWEPVFNEKIMAHDPVRSIDIDIEEIIKEEERWRAADGIMEYDEETKTLIVITEGNAKIRLELEQEAREIDRERQRLQDEEPKSFKEYQNKRLSELLTNKKSHTFDVILNQQDYDKSVRDKFQDRYYLTDEFRKTDKFEKLYNEYVDKESARDQKIADEVSGLPFALQAKHLNDTLGDSEEFIDSIVVSGKSRQEWMEHFDFMKTGFETILSEAKAVQKGDLIREDGTQRGDTRGGYANPDKAIPEIEKSIKYFDTLIDTLKDKWKYGSLDKIA
jgi:hypothetical protein